MNHYDDSQHVYTIDDVPVPSVTQVIPKPDFFCTPEQLEEARIDGNESHSLIKMFFDTGDTFGNSMLIALAEWLDDNHRMTGDLVLYEKPLFSAKHRYAGKPDALFTKSVIDFKRSFGNKKLHALQTAAYQSLAVENKIIPKVKTHLILQYNGKKFNAKNVYDPRAEDIFLSLVKKYYIERGYEAWTKKV